MTIRNEAIDQGARAIHSIDAYWVDHAWETLPEEARALFTRQATVAFDATREVLSDPDEAMRKAGAGRYSYNLNEEEAGNILAAMLSVLGKPE